MIVSAFFSISSAGEKRYLKRFINITIKSIPIITNMSILITGKSSVPYICAAISCPATTHH
jgi:hypothetical protein